MSNITVRFVHRESRTPVLELEGAEASATVGALRELLMERLASEEACMMRVFVKWHAEVEVGGRKRLIELTDEDAETSLSSMGVSHLSNVYLDGPLTGNSDGVGQALAVLGAQMHRVNKGTMRTNTLLEKIVAQGSTALLERLVALAEAQQSYNQLALLPSEAYLARQALAAEERVVHGQLLVMERAEEGYHRLLTEATAGLKELSSEAHLRPFPFSIDRTTPHNAFTVSDDGTKATKTSEGWATFRASKPLTAANRKWAVKIVVTGFSTTDNIVIGLLPKLSDAQVAQMEGDNGYIGSKTLGGRGMGSDGYKFGYWQCPRFTFVEGDVVVCDFNFAAKTLTLSCGDRKAVGTIPSIKKGDELYPAVSMYRSMETCWGGQQVAFVAE